MQYEKILVYIESGKKAGAKVHLGSNAANGGSKSYFIEPTIFTDVTPDMKIMREEIFDPVVAVAKFPTEEEVIELANDTSYGLAAGIHTKDYERAMRVTSALQAGTAWDDLYNFVHWSIPFGGYKESGIGRECGEAALDNYTETKAVYFKMGMSAPEQCLVAAHIVRESPLLSDCQNEMTTRTTFLALFSCSADLEVGLKDSPMVAKHTQPRLPPNTTPSPMFQQLSVVILR